MARLQRDALRKITEPGMYGDGDGLWLVIGKTSRSWVFKYRSKAKGPRPIRYGENKQSNGNRIVTLGLGPAEGKDKPGLSLNQARAEAREKRDMIDANIDPLKKRIEEKDEARLSQGNLFGKIADEFYEKIESTFRSPKHRQAWKTTVEQYCKPLRDKPITEIDVTVIKDFLAPYWKATPTTAKRIRGRLERIFASAKAQKLYKGDNPADAITHRAILGVSVSKLIKSKPFAALHYQNAPAFMAKLRKMDSTPALALQFAILCGGRTGEVLGATWDEIDLGKKLWTIPAQRMKMERAHEVPLVPCALEILSIMSERRDGDSRFVFPGHKKGKKRADDALLATVRKLDAVITTHGFRSTFVDWATEETEVEMEIVEFSVAHAVKSNSRRPYRRLTALQKRRKLLLAWSKFLLSGKN